MVDICKGPFRMERADGDIKLKGLTLNIRDHEGTMVAAVSIRGSDPVAERVEGTFMKMMSMLNEGHPYDGPAIQALLEILSDETKNIKQAKAIACAVIDDKEG